MLLLTSKFYPFFLYADISDHLSVCAEVKYKQIKNTAKRPFVRPFSQQRVEMFLTDL